MELEFHLLADGVGEIRLSESQNGGEIWTGEHWQRLEDVLKQASETARALLFVLGGEQGFRMWHSYREILSLSPKNAKQKIKASQSALNLLQNWSGPSVAVICGPVWNVGWEIALACQYRLAVWQTGSVGFPLLQQYGLLPMGGSLRRLAQRVGFLKGIQFLWQKDVWSVEEAAELGLIDRLLPLGKVRQEALRLLQEPQEGERSQGGEGHLSWWKWHWNRRKLKRQFRKHPFGPIWQGLLEVVSRSPTLKEDHAQGLEIKVFLELLQTPEVRRIWTLVFEELHSHPVKRWEGAEHVYLLGAGALGAFLAAQLLKRGCFVRLEEMNLHALSGALKRIRKHLGSEMPLELGKVSWTIGHTGCRHSQVVIEAVLEDQELKRRLLGALEAHISPQALVVTTTSSGCVHQLAQSLEHSERFLGLHFFPSAGRSVVEVVSTPQTSSEAYQKALELIYFLGAFPIDSPDRPGFLLSRLALAYFNEALLLLEEGLLVEEIDGAVVSFGASLGPLAHLDLLGMDALYDLFKALPEEEREHLAPSQLVEIFYKNGRLGKKNGKGFYLYEEGEVGRVDPKIYDLIRDVRKGRKRLREEIVRERLLLLLLRGALEALSQVEGLAPADLELAIVYSFGFPFYQGGILHYGQERGLESVVKSMKRLKKQWGERFEPGEVLLEYSQRKHLNFFQS